MAGVLHRTRVVNAMRQCAAVVFGRDKVNTVLHARSLTVGTDGLSTAKSSSKDFEVVLPPFFRQFHFDGSEDPNEALAVEGHIKIGGHTNPLIALVSRLFGGTLFSLIVLWISV